MIVYRLTCAATGKVYIGITRRSASARRKEHLANSKRMLLDRRHLYQAMRKHRDDPWMVEVIASGNSWDELCAIEVAQIVLHKSNDRKFGYNCTAGGDGCVSMVWTTEMRERASKSHKGKTLPPDQIEKLRRLFDDPAHKARAISGIVNYRHGPEHYARLSALAKGRTHTAEARAKISAASKGKPKSAQHIANNAAARIGYKKTPEQIERSAQFHRGRKRSEQTRMKQRDAALARYRKEKDGLHCG